MRHKVIINYILIGFIQQLKVGELLTDKADPKSEAIKLLKSIKTLDDLVKHKDEILDIVEESIEYGIDSLKSILKTTLSPQDLEKEMAKLELGENFIGGDLEKELERLANLEGAQEFIESLRGEMEHRLEPHAQKLGKLMGELMGKMMGEFMSGFGEAMESAFGEPFKDSKDDGDLDKSKERPKEKPRKK